MIKFYIHPENITLNWFSLDESFDKVYTTYDIYPAFFYLNFLPKNLKYEFLNTKIYKNHISIYQSILSSQFSLCENINQCDYILLKPSYHLGTIENCLHYLKPYIDESEKLNKKILFFYHGKFDEIPYHLLKNVILFTAPGILDADYSNIHGLPTFCEDLFENKFSNKKLSVSFCGSISHPIRGYILSKLSDKKYSDFIIRNGPLKKPSKKYAYLPPPKNDEKKDFIKNIENNLYGLCVRGSENYSYRLAELLMMGRIPILIDTKCILPFRKKIPYEKNCVYIKYDQIDNIIDILENYHNSHTEEELIDIQKENRNIWSKYFTTFGCSNEILNILENNLNHKDIINFNYV